MANPDFPLAPWEVPPGSDVARMVAADEVFCATWRGHGARMLSREVVGLDGQPRHFVRDLASDETGNWMVPPGSYDLDGIIEAIHRWPHRFERCFYFDGAPFDCPGLYQLHVGVNRMELYFHAPADEKGRELYLHTEEIVHKFGMGEFFGRRAASLGRWARAQMEDANSPLGSALRWTRLSLQAKQCLYYGLSRAEMALFQTLMVGVLRTQSTLWEPVSPDRSFLQEAPFRWRITRYRSLFDGESDARFDQLLEQKSRGSGRWQHRVPRRLKRWREMLCGHFGLWPAERNPCCDADDHFMDLPGIAVRVARPTAHEILEGAVVLSDWLRSVGESSALERLMQADESHLHLAHPVFDL